MRRSLLQNHPLMDPIQAKLDKLKARKPSEANPFVVGQANYQKFLDVMSACTEVNIARLDQIEADPHRRAAAIAAIRLTRP